MTRRRTRKQKTRAALLKAQHVSSVVYGQQQDRGGEISLDTVSFYVPGFNLPIEMVKKDLTKTVIVTILAMVGQVALAIYLNSGGWQLVNSLLVARFTGRM